MLTKARIEHLLLAFVSDRLALWPRGPAHRAGIPDGYVVKRGIAGFHLDVHGDWVADLDCGHGQHVRHRPPLVMRQWVTTEEGRAAMLGSELDCVRCFRMEWPDGLTTYHRTPEFDAASIPDGLQSEHATKRGVWGRIHVVEGEIKYHVGAPIHRSFRVDPASSAVIVPEVRHRVEPGDAVRFFVEFARVLK